MKGIGLAGCIDGNVCAWASMALALIFGAGSQGCSLLADSDPVQCTTDDACAAILGGASTCVQGVCLEPQVEGVDASAVDAQATGKPQLPERWECVLEPASPVPQRGRTVRVRFTVVYFGSFDTPADLEVKACAATDVMCEQPLVEPVTPDSLGFVELDVPHGFSGYFEITAPDIIVSLLYANRPYFEDMEFEAPAVVTPALSMALAMGGGETVDERDGIVIIDVFDCQGDAGPGVQFAQEGSGSDEVPFYFEGALPDRDRTSTTTTTQATRSMAARAFGGFSMVEQGYLTVLGRLEEESTEVGRVTVSVRPGVMTFAQIFAGY